jgi:dipeptidyl aminopeptidase/acylaminoacyl peptidase
MKKLVQLMLMMSLISPSITSAEEMAESVKVAFVKDDYLWIQSNGKTEKITTKKATYTNSPQWSFDGKMLLYQKEAIEPINEQTETQNELWVYDVKKKTHRKIFYDGYNPNGRLLKTLLLFNLEVY